MINKVELRYITIFSFSLVVVVVSLFLSINKLQPLLFQQIFTSCTAVYESITANSLIISSAFVLGLLTVLVCLSLKLVLSGHRTSQRLANFADHAQKSLPRQLKKVIHKMSVDRQNFIITNHKVPVAVTAGLLSPKIIFSKALVTQLTEKELEAVLLHEIYHQRNRHGMLFIVAEAIAAALAMLLPVLKDVAANMKIDFENAADQYAISHQGSIQYVSSALTKLSGSSAPIYYPAFATVADDRLAMLSQPKQRTRKISKIKLCFSIGTIMVLSFFATMPLDAANAVVYAHQSNNVCIKRVDIGMSKTQNSSSILPASVF